MKKQKFNSAIIPVVETEDNGFDEIPFEVEDRQRRKGKKKQLSKSKFLRDTRIKDESAASNNKWRHSLFEWRRTCRNTVDYLDVFLLSQRSRRLGAPFLLLGLILCGILEAIQAHFRYNVTIFLVLSAATLFPSFPKDSVRPQLCISVLTLLTYAMDIYKLSTKFGSRDGIITMVVFVMVCKSFVFNAFLRNATGAPRTRKYLDRRLRLFCVPFKQPKRIMRDVRGRFLALGWIHLFGVIAYVTFLLVFVFYFDYSLLLLSEQSGKMLPIYLLIKSFTTLAILLGILYDTDIILALWYFGCFGFNVSFVRQYIIRKRIELKGWPLAFAYYGLRFYILSFVKAIDVLWGLYGWYLIGSNFIDGFLRVEDSLKVFLTFLMYSMIITDIWCTVLFLSIRWLLKRQKMLRELKMLEVSDDSEIEEFRLRDELEPTISADAMKEQRRQEYRQRYIEEGFEGEPGTLKLAVTRKPSKADKLKTKGKSRIKENTIMPENPSNADIGYSNYEYEYDPEGQVIIYPIGNQSSFDDIYPNDVLDHPDDNIRTGRVDEAINPLLQKPKSTIISRSTSSRAVDVELDNYYDIYDGAGLSEQEMELIQKIDGTSKRISPIEFSELWELFNAKECKCRLSSIIRITNYFLMCCGLTDVRDFVALSESQKNSVVLKAFSSHLANIGIQVVAAGIYGQTELSLLMSKVVVNKTIILLEIKATSLSDCSSVDHLITCTSRANSIEYSRLGIRLLQLDKLFEIIRRK